VLVFYDYIMMDHMSRDLDGIVPVVNDFCVKRGLEGRVLRVAARPLL
jgi:hypothetical protein